MKVRHITPDEIVEAMISAGWQVVGENAGVYKRLAFVEDDTNRHVLLVPFDPTAPEHDHLMHALVCSLERILYDGQSAQQVLNRIQPGMYP